MRRIGARKTSARPFVFALVGSEINIRRRRMASRMMRRAWRVELARLALALLVVVGMLTQVASAGSNPQEIVRNFSGVLFSNMKDGRVLGESGRLARLRPAVARTFDIPEMTRLAVGPSWANLNPDQQQQLIAAFGHYVAATYADQFDTYSGEQLQVTGERPRGADFRVKTNIVK